MDGGRVGEQERGVSCERFRRRGQGLGYNRLLVLRIRMTASILHLVKTLRQLLFVSKSYFYLSFSTYLGGKLPGSH